MCVSPALGASFGLGQASCVTAAVASLAFIAALSLALPAAHADSVNSPNVTLNVDTNRAAGIGAGAGDVSVVINTITIAETQLAEYSAGSGRKITLRVRPGFQFDPTSNVTAQSATIGINGTAPNSAAVLTPAGIGDEVLTFNLTSGTSGGQDIIRINGVRLLIRSAEGAAGPAQTTMEITTTAAGGAFTNQGIVAANLTVGAPDRLVFATQPGSSAAGAPLLPAVKIVDFGGNLVRDDARAITFALLNNPGSATLQGTVSRASETGVAAWTEAEALALTVAANGYTMRASHDGAAFHTSDTADSTAFNITADAAARLAFSLQPIDTPAGADLLVEVSAFDAFSNLITDTPVSVTLDAANNPTAWPLLVDTSLTKNTENGVATWDRSDHLRITKKINSYRLVASGAGTPVQSDAFDVTAAAPNALRFVDQPVGTQEDTPLPTAVTVEIIDAFGNRTEGADTVTLNLQSPCGGNISGASATATAGLAAFGGLIIDTPCEGITLEAASGGLARTSSDAFAITAAPAPEPEPEPQPEPEPTPQEPASEPDVLGCGACGQGAVPAMLPLLLMHMGLCRSFRRGYRGRGRPSK